MTSSSSIVIFYIRCIFFFFFLFSFFQNMYEFTDDTLWTGTPGNYTDPHAQPVLQDVRKLVDSGNYAKASLAAFGLSGNPSDV